MSDAAAAATPAPAKKVVKVVKVAKAKKPKVAPTHPPVASMVNAAIVALKDRKGSSLAAIKKYIDANNKNVDSAKLAPFIKRYLKSSVAAGKLVQTKGTGAAGSFKLGKVEKPTVKKVKTPKKVKKPKAVKKAKSPKKVKKVKTPKKAAKKPAKKSVAKKVKTPKKVAKKPTKPAAKPKAKKPAAKKAPTKK